MKTSAYDWYPKPESVIETGNDICRMIDELQVEAHRLGIIEEADND